MEIIGLAPHMVAIFIGFGLLIGILFGFFGMGGSFLVTPGLLVLGYPAKVAVGTGLAFVFGTSIIGALRHRDLGHVDYTLAAIMTIAMTIGIEIGKRFVLFLEATGIADLVISVSYIGLLATVGIFTLRDVRTRTDDDACISVSSWVQSLSIPPMITLSGNNSVPAVIIFAIGLVVGGLSGFLGVGGGFLLMPAMVYGLGVPASIAIGTDILQITISGAFGAFVYAQANAVALPVVVTLLAGSAFGARIGAGATRHVNDDEIKGYFAFLLLAGSLAVATKNLSVAMNIEILNTISVILIFGAGFLVSTAVVLAAVCELRQDRSAVWCPLATS